MLLVSAGPGAACRLATCRRQVAVRLRVRGDTSARLPRLLTVCDATREVHQGRYGTFQLDDADVREVYIYRAGLAVAAAGLGLGATTAALAPEWDGLLNTLFFGGSAGLGVALGYIHMYAKPIKMTMQALYVAGLLGSAYVAATADVSVPSFVASHREAVWLIGPLFAAATGLAFKEGMCYGRPESAAIFFLLPIGLLGHLTGVLPEQLENILLWVTAGTMAFLSVKKWSQPIQGDVGDKSVFQYLAMSDAERDQLDRARGPGE